MQITEKDNLVVISGTYMEMRDILSKLKSRGFRYDPSDKTWWIEKSKMSDLKMKRLQELVDGKEEEIDSERTDKIELAVTNKSLYGQKISQSPWEPWYKISQTQEDFGISGDTYRIKEKLFKAGGRWSNPEYRFSWSLPTEKLELLFKFLDDEFVEMERIKKNVLSEVRGYSGQFVRLDFKEGKRGFWWEGDIRPFFDDIRNAGGEWDSSKKNFYFYYSKADVSKIRQVLRQVEETDRECSNISSQIDGKSWCGGDVSAFVDGNKLVIRSADRKYADDIKSSFRGISWTGGSWVISLASVDKSQISAFERKMEQKEKDIVKEFGVKDMGGIFQFSYGEGYYQIVFRKGDIIHNDVKHMWLKGGPEWLYVLGSTSTYFREDGLSFGVGDDSGNIYTVKVREATDEETIPYRAEQEIKLNKANAKKDLENIARDIQSKGEIPSGMHHLSGERIILDNRTEMYGGGKWFVLENGYVWYVQNNGADGDAWDQNNVSTGGAGAIGWRVHDNGELAERIISLARAL